MRLHLYEGQKQANPDMLLEVRLVGAIEQWLWGVRRGFLGAGRVPFFYLDGGYVGVFSW